MKDLFTENLKNPKRRAFMAAGAMGAAALVGTTLAGQSVAQTVAAEGPDPLGGATESIDMDSLPRVQQKLVPFFMSKAGFRMTCGAERV